MSRGPYGTYPGQLRPLGDAQLAQALGERSTKRAVPADDQAPRPTVVDESARKTSAISSGFFSASSRPDADQPQLAVVGARGRRLGRDHVALVDQRHRDLEQVARAPVAASELRADDDHAERRRQEAKRGLEEPRAAAIISRRPGSPVAHVGRQVLANPEHHPPSAQRRRAARTTIASGCGPSSQTTSTSPSARQKRSSERPAARATESGLARLS